MKREDLLEFARRDRRLVDELRTAHWVDLARVRGAAALLAVADGLRRQVEASGADWPNAADRLADIDSHTRVSGALHRVRLEPRR